MNGFLAALLFRMVMVALCHHGADGIQIMDPLQVCNFRIHISIICSLFVFPLLFLDRSVLSICLVEKTYFLKYYYVLVLLSFPLLWLMDADIHHTGLTCAIFTRDAVEIPCPDSSAGLYVKTRSGQIVKVYTFLLVSIVVV